MDLLTLAVRAACKVFRAEPNPSRFKDVVININLDGDKVRYLTEIDLTQKS